MEYRLSKFGAVCINGDNYDNSFIDPHVKLVMPGVVDAITVKLGNMLFATTFRYKNHEEHYVHSFRPTGGSKPRSVQVSSILKLGATSELDILKALFPLFLTFDDDRIGNRDRNTLLAAIRYHLPNVVKGDVRIGDKDYGYYMVTEHMTFFPKGTKQAVLRVNYTQFSRGIKDKLK